MELSEDALGMIMESVWAVSARRAFEAGRQSVTMAISRRGDFQTVAFHENARNAAPVLVVDEVRRRVQAIHDRANPDTSYGKGQRYALRQVMEELKSLDAVGLPLAHDGDRPRATDPDPDFVVAAPPAAPEEG